MRRYTILHPLYLSLYSRSLYRDVGLRWQGYGFAYLFLLVLLLGIPEMIKLHTNVSDFIAAESPRVVEQFPTITVTKGNASIDGPSPHVIYYPDKSVPFIVLDPSGSYTSLKDPGTVALLTKTKVLFRKGPSEVRAFDLAGIDHLVVDHATIVDWVELFRNWFAILLFPFVLLFSFFYYALQILLCAAAGTIFAKSFGVVLDHKALVRLAAVCFTPSALMLIVHSLLDIEFPLSGSIAFFFSLGYLYYAVGVNAEKENE
jgi:hypothetical protein